MATALASACHRKREAGGAELLVGLLNVVHEMQVVGAGEDHHLLGPGSAAVELLLTRTEK